MSDKILDALNNIASNLSDKQLKVGFIDGALHFNGTPIATIAAYNEYGNPANNQPPRPFFRKTIWAHENEWNEKIQNGIKNGEAIDDVLSSVGELAVGQVFESIASLMDPPIKDSTIRARRNRKNSPNQSTKPLVDRGLMNHDIHYEVGEIESDS
ncbi:hypothetical protein ACSFCW_16860 [Yokenella regensburgei]|uniref:hypothetical protein n=1 Tax=Yokenella regensburgei TaxID=158877 RepID=UPI003EDAF997